VEQTLFVLFGGVPGAVGIGLRGLAYRLILRSQGMPVIEYGVRLAQPATSIWGAASISTTACTCTACPNGIILAMAVYYAWLSATRVQLS